jgi:hypothetical protein
MPALALPGRGHAWIATAAAALALLITLAVAALLLSGEPAAEVAPAASAGPTVSAGPATSADLAPVAGAARASALTAVHHLPLSFEENAGQAPAGVSFVARAPGFALALGRDGSRLHLGAATLTTRFVGGAPTAVHGTDALPGRTNYLTGDRPADWHTGVRTFGGVRYASVWPGIDVAFHGNRRQLEYDYVLAPGADPGRIAQRIAGARGLRIDRAGDLVIAAPGGTLRQLAPVAYQERGGVREPVASRFVLHGDTVGVAVGAYDRSRPLTIDPTLAYATYLGGDGVDAAYDVKVDADGNTFVAGYTSSASFATDGAFQGTGGGAGDAFVAKLSGDGKSIEWLTYLGGSGEDVGSGVALEPDGDVVVAGTTKSTNFPTEDPTRPTYSGGTDLFVSRLNKDGDALKWSTYLGGEAEDSLGGVVVKEDESVVVGGTTKSHDLPVAGGGLSASYGGGISDGFVLELGPTGALTRGGYLGGLDTDRLTGLAVDGERIYATGGTFSTNFPITGGAQQSVLAEGPLGGPSRDAFVTRIDENLGRIAFSTFLGGNNDDIGEAIAVDDEGDAYIGGGTSSTDLPGAADGFQPHIANSSQYDAFVAKVPTLGSATGWSSYLGGFLYDAVEGIAVDDGGTTYLTGLTYSNDLATTDDALQKTKPGAGNTVDGFIAQVNPDGDQLEYLTYFGGTEYDFGSKVALGPDGNVVVVGGTTSEGLPTTSGSLQPAKDASNDGWVLALRTRRPTTVSLSCGTAPVDVGTAVPCEAIVADKGSGPSTLPTGDVAFASDGTGTFTEGGTCTLATGLCSLTYTPTEEGTGTHKVTATYRGDDDHAGAKASVNVVIKGTGGEKTPGGEGPPVTPPGTPPGDGSGGPGTPPGNGAGPPGSPPAGNGNGPEEKSTDAGLRALALKPASFRAAASGPSVPASAKAGGGTVVTFTLGDAASVRFTVERSDEGSGKKKGTKWTALKGSFTRAGTKGKNSFKFSGRLSNAKLAPGKYRLAATATVAGGKPGDAVTASFTIQK